MNQSAVETPIKDIIQKFESALGEFVRKDKYLLQVEAHERTMTHKLAEYLQPLFRDWNVDCEYNRDGHCPKKIKKVHLPDENDPESKQYCSVLPDIIIHQRGTKNNLLIIEAKPSKDRRGKKGKLRDCRKLEAYAGEREYRVGIFLVFNVGKSAKRPYSYQSYYKGKWHNDS